MASVDFDLASKASASLAPDVDELVQLLNNCLANEICRSLHLSRRRYFERKRSGGLAAGESPGIASEPQVHADLIAKRIVELGGELGGELDFQRRIFEAKGKLALACWGSDEHVAEDSLAAEALVIDGYHEVLRCIGSCDPKTRELIDRLRNPISASDQFAI